MRLNILTVAYGLIAFGGAFLSLQGPAADPGKISMQTPGLRARPGSSAGIPLLKTASIELPTEERAFPAAPGAELANQNCTSCHSPGMVLNQPLLSRAVWEEEVRKMRNTFHAPVAEQDIPALAAYLASIQTAD
jgi:mono/diheme cytochrome c family protein